MGGGRLVGDCGSGEMRRRQSVEFRPWAKSHQGCRPPVRLSPFSSISSSTSTQFSLIRDATYKLCSYSFLLALHLDGLLRLLLLPPAQGVSLVRRPPVKRQRQCWRILSGMFYSESSFCRYVCSLQRIFLWNKGFVEITLKIRSKVQKDACRACYCTPTTFCCQRTVLLHQGGSKTHKFGSQGPMVAR